MNSPASSVMEWLALRRVQEGGITKLGDQFLHHGQPVANYLAAALDELLDSNDAVVAAASVCGQQQISLTLVGEVRYATMRTTGEMDLRNGP